MRPVSFLLLGAAIAVGANECMPLLGGYCISDLLSLLIFQLTAPIPMFINNNIFLPWRIVGPCLGAFKTMKDDGWEDKIFIPNPSDADMAPTGLLALFGPKIPDEPNFFFKKEYKVPIWKAFDAMNRLREDGGFIRLIDEGSGYSPWPVLKNGARVISAGGIEEQILAFDPTYSNYTYTYYMKTIISPIATGGTVTIGVEPTGDNNQHTSFFMKGKIAGLAPACIISTLNPYLVWDGLLVNAQNEHLNGAFEYKGPDPIPDEKGIKFSM
mmetsp:Transcript_72395/g.120660  ORF Transcript_72395/g.120660 Transcript_72395/m.120660 type:complete len:269 (+) Transcript_72395:36-842(+)